LFDEFHTVETTLVTLLETTFTVAFGYAPTFTVRLRCDALLVLRVALYPEGRKNERLFSIDTLIDGAPGLMAATVLLTLGATNVEMLFGVLLIKAWLLDVVTGNADGPVEFAVESLASCTAVMLVLITEALGGLSSFTANEEFVNEKDVLLAFDTFLIGI